MDVRSAVEKLINVMNPGILTRLLLLPLTLCAFCYGFIISLRSMLYGLNILSTHHIGCKVITIGNITVGGTGKTPTVCFLARYLQEQGLRVAVLTRGYRGKQSDTFQIVSDGKRILASSGAAGDEAYMLAQKLDGIPVLAGKDRCAAGKRAVELFKTQVVLLDDGFQHHRLKRDLDIVLINAANPFGNGLLLPRGTLREPPAGLQRAGIILLTKTDACTNDLNQLQDSIKSYNPKAPIFTSSYRVVRLKHSGSGAEVPPAAVAGKKVAGLCSIGDPNSFFFLLQGLPVVVIENITFPDHHFYQEEDYAYIKLRAGQADCIVTTEKDIAKIDLNMLQDEHLIVVEIEQVVENGKLFFSSVKTLAGI
jgi:tetraacyldisaccharide 4'-kinase